MAFQSADLTPVFHALADPTRLAVIEQLCRGPAAITQLAAPYAMALPSFLKHVRVLEAAGLVTTEKRGRIRQVRLEPARLSAASDWFRDRRMLWNGRLDRLEALINQDGEGS